MTGSKYLRILTQRSAVQWSALAAMLHRISIERPAENVVAASIVVWSVVESSSVRSVATTFQKRIVRSRRQRLSGSPNYGTINIDGG